MLQAVALAQVVNRRHEIGRSTGGDSHERMGKADLGAVDGAVARRLDEGEEVMVSGVDDNLLEDGLGGWNVIVSQLGLIFSVQDANSSSRLRWSGARTLSDSIVEAIVAVVLCCAWF